jgi:hypothetical protein
MAGRIRDTFAKLSIAAAALGGMSSPVARQTPVEFPQTPLVSTHGGAPAGGSKFSVPPAQEIAPHSRFLSDAMQEGGRPGNSPPQDAPQRQKHSAWHPGKEKEYEVRFKNSSVIAGLAFLPTEKKALIFLSDPGEVDRVFFTINESTLLQKNGIRCMDVPEQDDRGDYHLQVVFEQSFTPLTLFRFLMRNRLVKPENAAQAQEVLRLAAGGQDKPLL